MEKVSKQNKNTKGKGILLLNAGAKGLSISVYMRGDPKRKTEGSHLSNNDIVNVSSYDEGMSKDDETPLRKKNECKSVSLRS